jgi:ribonuclease P protein component
MVGRIVRSADFQRVLSTLPRSRSTHFAAHHVPVRPSVARKPMKKALPEKLSTGGAPSCPPLVDESSAAAPQGHWLGMVVPKKHARRAATRNLLKRQMRTLMQAQAGTLPAGLWVLRLKAPFDRKLFASAASEPLQDAARSEIVLLLQRAAARG